MKVNVKRIQTHSFLTIIISARKSNSLSPFLVFLVADDRDTLLTLVIHHSIRKMGKNFRKIEAHKKDARTYRGERYFWRE